MTDDTTAVGRQRLIDWLVGSRGVTCPTDQVRVRVRDRQTIPGEYLSLRGASQSSIAIAAMNKPIGNFRTD